MKINLDPKKGVEKISGALQKTSDFGKDISAQVGVKSESGAYRLKIDPKSVSVIGYDEKGAFHGLQTLKLILDESEDMRVPCCLINDWPDRPRRGIVDS